MDILPHAVIRKIQLGQGNKVLGSKTIWHCGSCETCVTRCPNEIDIPKLMDWLRQTSLQKKITVGDKNVPIFHHAFLDSIRRWGRQYELGMLLKFKLDSKDYFSDLDLGIKMMLRHKLPFLPARAEGTKDIKKLFKSQKQLHL
jgi:heterodisulfide reductase subunit C